MAGSVCDFRSARRRASHWASIRWVAVLLAVSAALLTPSPACAQSVAWRQLYPKPRYGHAMAYDASRKVTVMFGGSVANGVRVAETWEWDGSSWTLRSTSGPSPRQAFAMAYDARRHVTVLFGGSVATPSGSALNGETWEWDGATWTRRNEPGPGARAAHAMAYDANRGVMVLTSGIDEVNWAFDTWEWDGNVWTQTQIGGSPLPNGMMVFDPARGACVCFGGRTAPYSYSDRTLVLTRPDGDSWNDVGVSGPSARAYGAASFDERRGVAVLFGGMGGTFSADTWLWNGQAWTQADVPGPRARIDHAMAYDSDRGVTVLFGGQGGGLLADTWEWNGSAWSQRAGTCPPSRDSCAMVYDRARGVTVLFGGEYWTSSTGVQPFGDTWEWDGAAWNSKGSVGPSARWDMALAYDAARGNTVLFGGASLISIFRDTWTWDGNEWAQHPVAGPAARSGHAMAFDAARNVAILFGGLTADSA